MGNTLKLPKGFTEALDEVYKKASVTADLSANTNFVKQGANAKEIQYPQLTVSGLGDYDRNSGYTTGAVDLKWATATCNYDRGTKISVDVMDNEESQIQAFALAAAELVRTKVASEGDAFTFATLAGKAGVFLASGEDLTTGAKFLESLLTAISKMDEEEVPEEQRVLYANSTLLNSVMALDTTKSREVLGRFAKTVSVPQSRFYTAIDLLKGKDGEEAGHYKKNANAKDINFVIVHEPAVIKYDKHIANDIILASANPDADADILKYRKYGLVDVYKNKLAGVYISTK